jgi:tetraacyldisaccharide 4'-kinase
LACLLSAATWFVISGGHGDDTQMRPLSTLWRAFLEGEARPLARWTLGPLLTTLSYPYGWAHQLRLQAYHRRWLAVKRLPCRVISIGNLTLGGTGKTPMVEAVANLLRQEGLCVGILSRGYGGSSRAALSLVSDGEKCLLSPDVAGDEPVLLAERLPGVPVVVGRNRYAAGMLAVKRFGVGVIVLDDGFQHVQLARDLDILLLDASRPFGNGRLFPRGDLRERPTALARAQVTVFTRWNPDSTHPSAAPQLPPLTPPIFYSQHQPLDLRVLNDGRILPLTTLKGRRILAFCGIGTPDHFRQTLQRLEAEVVTCMTFPDHHPYARSDIGFLVQKAKDWGAEMLVTTEKDGVRLRKYRPTLEHIWELRIRATIVASETLWRTYILGTIHG